MKRKTIVMQKRQVAMAICGMLIGTATLTTTSCSDDVLTGQPSWLGNSIYERLQEDGHYKTTLRLIDDLGQAEVLGHTGSKTLFAADDNAYNEWFGHNSWGVNSYEQLTEAQKKLLLNNSMINNAYLIELMSNVSGNPPMEGMAMRRETAASIYDSVYIMPASKMPGTEAWASYRERGKSMPIFKDGTAAPMIHFLPAFMRYYKITDEDLAVLTNGQATSTDEAWVNGKKVIERDITCKNGYVQKVDGVIESSPNMAEILRQHPQMSMWSALIDRFSAPYYHANGTREYNRIYNNEDSVFTLRYYSKRSLGGQENNRMPNGETAPAQLSFDPGWNHYMYSNTMGYDLHYDAGAMIVPTNEALTEWWNGDGRDLQDEYKSWDSIPAATLAKLLNVNMLPTFTESVPSKFDHVLNDAKEPLGIKVEDIDSCFMGCNGVVYLVNKVFAPAEYASVAYPALAHQSTMNIIYWAIETSDNNNNKSTYLPYLLSMDSKYALLMPTNDAMFYYIDPATYGATNNVTGEGDETYTVEAPQMISFRYDPTKSSTERVQASRFNCTVDADGNITQGSRTQLEVGRKVINKMLDDLVNQLIIVIPDKSKTLEDYVREGYQYFKTKGGSLVKVMQQPDGSLAFAGGWQMEHNDKPLPATEVYTKTNGRSYQIEDQVPMTAQKSLFMTLREHSEYSSFFSLLDNDFTSLLSEKLNNKYTPSGQAQGNKNMSLFDNYNYTVYVPTNSSLQQMQRDGLLPTDRELDADLTLWEEEVGRETIEHTVLDSICEAEHWYAADATWEDKEAVQEKVRACVKGIISDFIRYHVQDHSLAIGMAPEAGQSDNNYESMMRNPETGRFFPLTVDFDNEKLSVTDYMGNTRQVQKTEGLYNNVCREYWFDGTNNSARLFMASDAVVHLVNAPLFFETMKPWREVVRTYLNNN